MKKIRVFLAALIFIMAIFCVGAWTGHVKAAEGTSEATGAATEITINDLKTDADGNEFIYCSDESYGGQFSITVSGIAADLGDITLKSSNESVVKLDTASITPYQYSAVDYEWISYVVKGQGTSTITIAYGDVEKKIKIIVMPEYVTVSAYGVASYDTVSLNWKKLSYVSGYNIYRGAYSDKDSMLHYAKIGSNTSANNCSFSKKAGWNKEYHYVICPYIKLDDGSVLGVNDKKYTSYYGNDADSVYTLAAPTGIISSVKQSGKKVTVIWDKNVEAASYTVYGSPNENGPYKKLKTISDSSKNSYTYSKAPLGDTYYFMVAYTFPNKKTVKTEALGVYVKGVKTINASEKQIKITQQYKKGQYTDWFNYSNPDRTFYYKLDDKLHVVYYSNQKLFDYIITLSGKTTFVKKVNLGNINVFGGFYKGTDDNFYVATAYNNIKESKKKTVIKLTKYDSGWNKLKTCNIKGGVKNVFEGIYLPVSAGNLRMDMSGKYLYVTTCREMFKSKDGLHHQSNIDFLINTNSMKLIKVGPVYSSHSFNQFVKLKSGNAYFANHGDAYPRCVYLTAVDDFAGSQTTSFSGSVFDIKGDTGDNYTGLTLGGMEVGQNYILTAGNSVPQFLKVDGVTGNKSGYNKNVFLTVTDKNTGKNKLIWLTKYNPKKSNTIVHEVRLIKISDTRFAVMYTETTGGIDTLKYVLVKENGKVVTRKTYNNIYFSAGSQPIIYKGAIVWTDVKENGKRFLCQIPVVTD